MMQKAGKKPWAAIALFIGPLLVYYAAFILYPLGATFYNSFHRIFPGGGELVTKFVGLDNFRLLLEDEIFSKAVVNTLIWSTAGPALEMIVATALAFILYFKIPLRGFYRTAWFSPMLVTGVIVGLIFKWIFNAEWGLVNSIFRAVGWDRLALNWFGNMTTPLWVVIFVHFWNTFGYSFVILMAGLSSVPEELIESASLDGANRRTLSFRILFPILFPVFGTVLMLSFLGKMRAFHVVWVMTEGGPMHASETVATYIQKRAFQWPTMDLGYPSAIAVLWFVIVIVGVNILSRWIKGKNSESANP
jgi:multiple sugar transport system permease protein/raffinose/stachyose/melibiose transport system permease protein